MEQHSSSPFNAEINEDEIDLKEILFKYLRHWKMIAICALVGLALAVFFNKLVTPIYLVEASVLIKDEESGMLGADIFESVGFSMPKSNVENEIGILRSYSIIGEALDELNFNVQYFEENLFKKTELYRTSPILVEVDWSHAQLTGGLFAIQQTTSGRFMLTVDTDDFFLYTPTDPTYKTEVEFLALEEKEFGFGEWITGESFKFRILDMGLESGVQTYFKITDTPALTEHFRELLEVSPTNKLATVLSLKIELNNRKKGADFLNKLMEVYLRRELNEKNRTASNTIFFIEQQLSGITDSLSFIEDRLENYRSRNNVFNLTEEGSLIFRRMEELEEEKSRVELSLSYYTSMEEYLKDDQLNDLISPSFIGVQDPLLNALVVSLAELQSEKVRLSASFSEETPAVREVNSKIRNTQRALAENLRNAKTNAENSLNEIRDRITRAEREVNRLPATERNLLSIQRQFSINENIYIYLLEKRAEAEITRASNYPTHAIVDEARSQSKPVFPKALLNYVIGLFIGIIVPIGFITIRDLFNTKVSDPHEVEKKLRVPLIGLIGHSKYTDALVVKNNPKSVITESFRNVRANMSYLTHSQKKLVVALSSSISGEGKTFCSINLASIYAISGKKVLLVGLDLRKPRIADDFGLVNDIGISTYLSREGHWKPMLKPSGIENMDILLSGPIPPNPAELILQDKFVTLISELKEAYDIIVLDCPPVGLVSETLEIFKHSDINIMILRHEYSEKSACDYINSLHEQNGVKKLYTVLNSVVTKTNYGGYGKYGYGSSYGYGQNGYGYHEENLSTPWWKKVVSGKFKGVRDKG